MDNVRDYNLTRVKNDGGPDKIMSKVSIAVHGNSNTRNEVMSYLNSLSPELRSGINPTLFAIVFLKLRNSGWDQKSLFQNTEEISSEYRSRNGIGEKTREQDFVCDLLRYSSLISEMRKRK
jgi:hypothetical protein